MQFLIADIFFFIIGSAYMWIRYRKREKVKQVLIEEFDNSFVQVGRLKFLQLIAGMLLAMFIVLLFAMFYGLMKHNLKWF